MMTVHYATMKTLLPLAFLFSTLTAAETLPLWPNGAPGSEARTSEPETLEGSNVCNVHNPSLTPYLPDPAQATGTAVIISVVYPNGRAPVETTLTGADTIRELRMDKSTITTLESAVAEAMAQIGHSTDGTLNVGTTGTSS